MKEQLARERTEAEHKAYGILEYFEEMQEKIRDIKWILRKVKVKDPYLELSLKDAKDLIAEHHKARKKQARQISRDADKVSVKLAKVHAKIQH